VPDANIIAAAHAAAEALVGQVDRRDASSPAV
jgi:hypothetical protein